jgi:hypothetical protein
MPVLLSLVLGLAGAVDLSGQAPAAKSAPGVVRPFDLTYLPRRTPTVIAVRPGELLKQLGDEQKDVAETVRRFLAAGFAFLDGDLKAASPPALADIEQLVVAARFRVATDSQPDGRGAMGVDGLSAGVVRTAKPFDWKGAVKKWFPKAETVKHAGREYVRVPLGVGKDKSHLALFVADSRTLVFDLDEGEVRDMLGRVEKKIETPLPAGWDGVSREMVAVWQDATAEGWLVSPREPKRAADRAMVAAFRGTTSLAVGFSAGKETTLRLVATARDVDEAQDVRAALKAMLKAMPDTEVDSAAAKLFSEATVRCKGSEVRVSGSVPGNLIRRMLDPDAER